MLLDPRSGSIRQGYCERIKELSRSFLPFHKEVQDRERSITSWVSSSRGGSNSSPKGIRSCCGSEIGRGMRSFRGRFAGEVDRPDWPSLVVGVVGSDRLVSRDALEWDLSFSVAASRERDLSSVASEVEPLDLDDTSWKKFLQKFRSIGLVHWLSQGKRLWKRVY